MRLINADELVKAVEASRKNNPHTDPKVARNHNVEHSHFLLLISEQPTAFDVDTVMEKIAEQREDYYLNDDVYDAIAVDALDFASDAIEKGMTAKKTEPQPAERGKRAPAEDSRWTPVEEGLPPRGQVVLAAVTQKDPMATHKVILTNYNGEKFWEDGHILAWMPAPIYPYHLDF